MIFPTDNFCSVYFFFLLSVILRTSTKEWLSQKSEHNVHEWVKETEREKKKKKNKIMNRKRRNIMNQRIKMEGKKNKRKKNK